MPSLKFHYDHIRLDKLVNSWARERGELPGSILLQIINAAERREPILGTFIDRKSGRYLRGEIVEDYNGIETFDENTIQDFMKNYYLDKLEFCHFCESYIVEKLPKLIANYQWRLSVLGSIIHWSHKLTGRDPRKSYDKTLEHRHFLYRSQQKEPEVEGKNDNQKVSIAEVRGSLISFMEEQEKRGERVTKSKGFTYLSTEYEGRVSRNLYNTRIWPEVPQTYKKPGRPIKKAV